MDEQVIEPTGIESTETVGFPVLAGPIVSDGIPSEETIGWAYVCVCPIRQDPTPYQGSVGNAIVVGAISGESVPFDSTVGVGHIYTPISASSLLSTGVVSTSTVSHNVSATPILNHSIVGTPVVAGAISGTGIASAAAIGWSRIIIYAPTIQANSIDASAIGNAKLVLSVCSTSIDESAVGSSILAGPVTAIAVNQSNVSNGARVTKWQQLMLLSVDSKIIRLSGSIFDMYSCSAENATGDFDVTIDHTGETFIVRVNDDTSVTFLYQGETLWLVSTVAGIRTFEHSWPAGKHIAELSLTRTLNIIHARINSIVQFSFSWVMDPVTIINGGKRQPVVRLDEMHAPAVHRNDQSIEVELTKSKYSTITVTGPGEPVTLQV